MPATATPIITKTQFLSAIDADSDFDDDSVVNEVIGQASQRILQKTGYDFGADSTKNPLAVQCCELLAHDIYFRTNEHGESIDQLLWDLKDVAEGTEVQ